MKDPLDVLKDLIVELDGGDHAAFDVLAGLTADYVVVDLAEQEKLERAYRELETYCQTLLRDLTGKNDHIGTLESYIRDLEAELARRSPPAE